MTDTKPGRANWSYPTAVKFGVGGTLRRLTRSFVGPYAVRTVHDGLLHAHSSLLGAMQLRASDDLEGGEEQEGEGAGHLHDRPLARAVVGLFDRSPPDMSEHGCDIDDRAMPAGCLRQGWGPTCSTPCPAWRSTRA